MFEHFAIDIIRVIKQKPGQLCLQVIHTNAHLLHNVESRNLSLRMLVRPGMESNKLRTLQCNRQKTTEFANGLVRKLRLIDQAKKIVASSSVY